MNPKNRIAKTLAVILLSLLGIANVQAAVNINYVVNNHLGAPVLLVDQNQHVVWQAEYDEFGKATILVEEVEFNVRFPGQYYDKETGLTYNYYRDYDPSLGRYVQSDPIGLKGGINTYGYVGGNPVSYVDPTGESAVAVTVCRLHPYACAAAGGAELFCILNPELCNMAAQACTNAAVKLSDMMNGTSLTPIIIAAIISQAVEGDDAGGDEQPDEKDLTKVKEKDGNKVAEDMGYDDAHDAKKGRGEGGVDIYKDKKSGDYWLWNGVRGGGKERL